MFTNHITAADIDGAAVFTLLKNGAASGLAVSSGAGQTGYFMLSGIDSVDFDVGDTCANQIEGAGDPGSSITWASGTLRLEASS